VVWLLSLSRRLILNRPRSTGGLLSPLALRFIGALLILGPIAAAVSGALFAEGAERWWRIIQACIYFLAGLRLFQLAAVRSRLAVEDDTHGQPTSGA
jgi:hypothetical protein